MNERQAVSDYTPTTADVRDQFAAYEDPRKKQFYDYPTEADTFDRWLAAHDAEIRGVDPVALDALAERKAMAYHDSECLLRPEIRTAALEEAAGIADRYNKGYAQHPHDGIVKSTQAAIAKAIRAAKDGD